jgi:hypothetical protein
VSRIHVDARVDAREWPARNKTIKFTPTCPTPNKLRGLYSLRRNLRVAPLLEDFI